jgi:predicted nicotinamide N-methyase
VVAKPSSANLRAFVRRRTTLRPVPDLPGIRLHTGDDVAVLWRLAGTELGLEDPPLPFWAFPWAGGLAVARYLADHPAEIRDRRVLDLAAGSGLCAIVAASLGAASVHAFDIDPLSEAAVNLNARANGVRIAFSLTDPLEADPPTDVEVILAGDVCYEETMADRAIAYLRVAARRGARILLGDPGRRYLPSDLQPLATYHVRTTHELEKGDLTESRVFAVVPGQTIAH